MTCTRVTRSDGRGGQNGGPKEAGATPHANRAYAHDEGNGLLNVQEGRRATEWIWIADGGECLEQQDGGCDRMKYLNRVRTHTSRFPRLLTPQHSRHYRRRCYMQHQFPSLNLPPPPQEQLASLYRKTPAGIVIDTLHVEVAPCRKMRDAAWHPPILFQLHRRCPPRVCPCNELREWIFDLASPPYGGISAITRKSWISTAATAHLALVPSNSRLAKIYLLTAAQMTPP